MEIKKEKQHANVYSMALFQLPFKQTIKETVLLAPLSMDPCTCVLTAE